jgi:hypothetical protein
MISGSTVGVLHDWKDHSEDPTLVNNTWRLYSEAGTLSNEVNVTPPPPSGDTFMFTPSRGASDTGPDSPAFEPVDLYPFVYALPDGNIFVHSRTTSRILSNPDKLDPNNLTSTWSARFTPFRWSLARIRGKARRCCSRCDRRTTTARKFS